MKPDQIIVGKCYRVKKANRYHKFKKNAIVMINSWKDPGWPGLIVCTQYDVDGTNGDPINLTQWMYPEQLKEIRPSFYSRLLNFFR